MASASKIIFLLIQGIVLLSVLESANAQGLKVGFYAKSCPNAEAIVKKVIDQTMAVAPTLAGPLLRMHFHDCFVRGCDASVLLNSPSNQSEKNAIPNQSLRGFGVIDRVKVALEKACPRVVSCSDILAVVARDVVVADMGIHWDVETGRRDGNVSVMVEALQNLPSPASNISTLITSFASKGLSTKDLVVLSGGHTIGTSHCPFFSNRIYNFTGKNDTDPALDSNYIAKLRMKCKPNDQTTLVEMDPGSFKTFDCSYYTLVAKRRGLFSSDAALLDNSETKAYVQNHASFLTDFGVSMVNMGRIGVLTGNAGEIRKVCSKTN